MLGKSSRFFSAGYKVPKYELELNGETVFSNCVKTFSNYFLNMPFLFLVRSDFNALEFVGKEVINLGIKNYRIIEFNKETQGQADSVYIGTMDYRDNTPLIIFNIDTIRNDFLIPSTENFCDGFLEVFEASGNQWSFVKVNTNGDVIETAEKNRISDLCSNGMYGFKKLGDYRDAFNHYKSKNKLVNGELYIAPIYNYLIKKGLKIKYKKIDKDLITLCGTPEDYEALKNKN